MPDDTSLEAMLSQFSTWLYERAIDRTYERLLSSRGVAERLEGPEFQIVWLEEMCPSVELPLPPAPPVWPALPETVWVLPNRAVNEQALWYEESAPGASPLDPRLEGDNTARVEAAVQQPGQHDLHAMSLEQIDALLSTILLPEVTPPLDASEAEGDPDA